MSVFVFAAIAAAFVAGGLADHFFTPRAQAEVAKVEADIQNIGKKL